MDMGIIGGVITLVSVLVVVFVIIGVVRIVGGMGKSSAERDRLLREGMQASARLAAVQMGQMSVSIGVHRHLQLHLQLEVHLQGRPPYAAMLTTMVSELQIPQLQPGAMLMVRVDRNNPMNLALEGVSMPQAYPPPGYPPPGYPQPGSPQAGVYRGPEGFPQPMMMPIGAAPVVPGSAKLGLWLGIGGAIVGLIVAAVVVAVNVGGIGLDSASEGDGVCAEAVRCCEVATAANPAAQTSCKNLGKLGVPATACQQTLQAMRESAKAQGITCK